VIWRYSRWFFDTLGWVFFLVMEMAEGVDLAEYLGEWL
jgi:hypothetical protein